MPMNPFSWRVCIFVLLALAACSPHARATPPDPLVGDWLYYRNDPVTFNTDGTARWQGGGHGTWEYLHNPEAQRHYRIIWDEGRSVDTLSLGEDDQHAYVVNDLKPLVRYHVRRAIPDLPAAGVVAPRDPVVGDWVWKSGHSTVFYADGTALHNSSLHGVWEYLPGPGPDRKYQVSWEHGKYVETFVCAPDAQSASVTKAGYPPYEAHRVAPDHPAASAPGKATPAANPFGTAGH